MSKKTILILIIFLLLVGSVFIGVSFLKKSEKVSKISEEEFRKEVEELRKLEPKTTFEISELKSISTSTIKISSLPSPNTALEKYWSAIRENNLSEAQKYLSSEVFEWYVANWGSFDEFVKKMPPHRGFQKIEISKVEWLPEGEFLGTQVRIYSTEWWKDRDGEVKENSSVNYLMAQDGTWKIFLAPILGSLPIERVKEFYRLNYEGKHTEAEELLSSSIKEVVRSVGGLKKVFEGFFEGKEIKEIVVEKIIRHQPRLITEGDEFKWRYDFWAEGNIYYTDGTKEKFSDHLVEMPEGFKIGYE